MYPAYTTSELIRKGRDEGRLEGRLEGEVRVLYNRLGYSTKEIAGITEQKESSVRAQLTRARRMLKNFLEGEEST